MRLEVGSIRVRDVELNGRVALDDHVAFVIEALRPHAAELGLGPASGAA